MSANDLPEVWRDVPGYEGCYQVSDLGRVRSLPRALVNISGTRKRFRGRILCTPPNSCGYPHLKLRGRGAPRHRNVHTLVLLAFVGPRPDGQVCRHLDGNPANNRLDNLCWGTPKENAADASRHGTSHYPDPVHLGERNGLAKLTEASVRAIRQLHANGLNYRQLGRQFGVSWQTIRGAVIRRTWAHVA